MSLAVIKVDLKEGSKRGTRDREIRPALSQTRPKAKAGPCSFLARLPSLDVSGGQAQPCEAIYCSSAAMRLASDGCVEANSGVEPWRCSAISRHRAMASEGR